LSLKMSYGKEEMSGNLALNGYTRDEFELLTTVKELDVGIDGIEYTARGRVLECYAEEHRDGYLHMDGELHMLLPEDTEDTTAPKRLTFDMKYYMYAEGPWGSSPYGHWQDGKAVFVLHAGDEEKVEWEEAWLHELEIRTSNNSLDLLIPDATDCVHEEKK